MIGVKSTNAMIALIYEKQLKLSSATNKRFSQGEIVNFVQVDAQKMQMISENLAYIAKYPIVFIVCFALLFFYIGTSFFAGLGVFFFAFLINTFISKMQARLQKNYMKKQDARVSATTEALNNIKMLKLYSWTERFESSINQKREMELGVLWRRLNIAMISVTSLYFFPQVISAVVFSVYISSGHTLDLATAYTVMTIFNNLKVSYFLSFYQDENRLFFRNLFECFPCLSAKS
jgi:ABC-type transport system involved in cytochrome bd biosynthesis fused ATPase/permease subunit